MSRLSRCILLFLYLLLLPLAACNPSATTGSEDLAPPKDGTDLSVPAQEILVGNSRGFWVSVP